MSLAFPANFVRFLLHSPPRVWALASQQPASHFPSSLFSKYLSTGRLSRHCVVMVHPVLAATLTLALLWAAWALLKRIMALAGMQGWGAEEPRDELLTPCEFVAPPEVAACEDVLDSAPLDRQVHPPPLSPRFSSFAPCAALFH